MLLDPRGPRFAAALTTVVLIAVLVTGSGWLMLAQAVVFALSAASPRWSPYGLVYRALVAPRLGRPSELEPAAPVRFAQLVGLVFATVSAIGYLTGASLVGLVAAAFALIAAFLNAAFGLCLGCEVYLAFRRLTHRPVPARVPAPGA
jgi:predicted PurR-regulated permease PerM